MSFVFNQVPWIPHEEELALFLGVQPRPWRTLLTDFELGKALLFNPPSTAAFRLTGPHQWAGARDVVINAQKTYKKALSEFNGDSYLSLVYKKIIRLIVYFLVIAVAILLAGTYIGL